jgi:hypothetical protein
VLARRSGSANCRSAWLGRATDGAYGVATPPEEPDDSVPDIAAGAAPGGWDFPLLPWGAKLAALSIGPEEPGEGAMASGLGLRQAPGRSRGSAYNYNWMHGRRHGRQVEVRLGRSEEYFKGLSFGSQKHMRQVVWVRVRRRTSSWSANTGGCA